MEIFEKIEFKKTDDKSVGLYSKEINDIFHSKTGAYQEAKEKFVNPIIELEYFNKLDKFEILDICYGIGYNSKAFISSSKNKKFIIDALEFSSEYIYLSPVIKDTVLDLNFKVQLLYQIIKNKSDIDFYSSLIKEIEKRGLNEFFDEVMLNFINFILNSSYKSHLESNLNSFLHNIYYEYMSNSMYKEAELNKNNNFTINYHINDARITIKELITKYDVVFLDAFSSQKDPTLWTIDFLSLVKSKMKENSILVSYSKSTPFRSALLELGFFVGKTFINEIDMGTVASFNNSFIINPLNDFDIDLIKTRSGITFKDSKLNLSSDSILRNRDLESKSSGRISRTRFIKESIN